MQNFRRKQHMPTRNMNRAYLLTVLFLLVFCLSTPAAFAQFNGPTPLTLVNGWTDVVFGTSHASVELQNNIVQLRGGIGNGTTSVAFTLPVGFRPATAVYVPVDLCNSHNGRLLIQTNGVVNVQAESNFADAQCFTSLDGASFALSGSGFVSLTMINGWTGAPFLTSSPAIKNVGGVIHFKGAMATTGTNDSPFVIPSAFRPSSDVYVNVDLCNATKGRLHIATTGAVDVTAESGTFSNAQCFTSLDGAFYLLTPGGIRVLTPNSGWTGAPFETAKPQAVNSFGVVFFKGAIASTGTSNVAFTLPNSFRPVTNVYVPTDLCDGRKGRLDILPNGNVIVEAESNFSDAQCFTSLDGASFVQ